MDYPYTTMPTGESDRCGNTFRMVLHEGRSIGRLYRKHGTYRFVSNSPGRPPLLRVTIDEIYAALRNGDV